MEKEIDNFTVEREDFIVNIIFHKDFNEKDFQKILKIIETFFIKEIKICLIIDTTRCSVVHLKYAVLLSSWMKTKKEQIINYLICSALIIKSPIVKKLLKTAFTIQSPSRPNLISSDRGKCIIFCEKEIEKIQE